MVKASDSKSDSLWERRFESYRLRHRVLLWHSAMDTIPLYKNYPTWARLCLQWLGGLGGWFALRVREVPGSIPGRARPFLVETRLEGRFVKEVKIFFVIRKECKTNMERWGIEPQAFRMRSGRSTTELLPQFSKSFVCQQSISYYLRKTCQNCGKDFGGAGDSNLVPNCSTMQRKVFDSGGIRTHALSDWCLKPAP